MREETIYIKETNRKHIWERWVNVLKEKQRKMKINLDLA